ncbi:MAG: VCBS repeat-containing protein [Gammaproteobacteria bacterium]|nr:VCBS repeat-containing protein [Gammaproteobacteria bacterium]
MVLLKNVFIVLWLCIFLVGCGASESGGETGGGTGGETGGSLLVFVGDSSCQEGNDPHWQCDGRWRNYDDLQPTDFVAICPGSEGVDYSDCSDQDEFVLFSSVDPSDGVWACAGTSYDGSENCTQAVWARTENLDDLETVVDSGGSGGGGSGGGGSGGGVESGLNFQQMTAAVIDQSPAIPQVFWAGMPDVNGDGCLDLYIGAHADSVDSSMLIHDNVNDNCQGTFTHFPDNDNYSQASPATPRITSRYMFGNWYGHPLGFWSFAGQDVDGSASAKYVLDPSFTTVGGQPQYLDKSGGCYGSRPKCIPIEIDGDGVIEMAYRSFDAPYNTGYVVNASNGQTIYPSNGQNGVGVGSLVVFDVDNDGYPEIVNSGLGGYFEYDAINGEMDWVSGKFSGTVPGQDITGNHKLPLDYDNDGDLDLFVGAGEYNQNTDFEPYLFRNDGNGNFVNVTASALSGIALSNTAYNTTYGNSQIADINLDGYPDILFGAETYNNIVTFLLNNGDGTFSRTEQIDFTPSNFGNDSRRPWFTAADYDNDGLIDIVHNGPGTGSVQDGQLYRNTTVTDNNWIRVRVRGFGDNTDGLHSRLTFFRAGTTEIVAHNQVGAFSAGYQNLITHTGTGSNTQVDLRVEYPHGGPVCNFQNVSTNSDYVVLNSCELISYQPGSPIPLN